MRKMKLLNKSKGITLIALVITIVILIILATVAINSIFGENGLIKYAERGKELGEKDSQNIDKSLNEMEKYLGDISDEYIEQRAYGAEVSEEDIAPTRIFNFEIIDEAETQEVSSIILPEEMPTKKVRINGLNPKYCTDPEGYKTEDGEEYLTNYEIVLEDGSKITDTLVIPYIVNGEDIEGGEPEEKYVVTEVNLATKYGKYTYFPTVKTIIYPNTVEKISGGLVFSRDKSNGPILESASRLKNVILPNKLKEIGYGTFSSRVGLEQIEIPDTVTSIGDGAFFACYSLTTITIPDTVTSIGDSAFFDCYSLTTITIPDTVTSIGDRAFLDCYSLTTITIPDTVTSIGQSAFSGCSSLTSIEIPDTVTSIGYGAFFECSSLTTVNYKGTKEQWNNINIDLNNSELTNATIICSDGTIEK